MKSILKLVIISTSIIFAFSSTYAESTFWRGDPPNRKVRQTQASDWLNCLKKLEKQIPTLSPSEKIWLETEYDKELEKERYEKLTRRAISAMDSREYHIRVARSHIGELIKTLTVLADNKSIERDKEIEAWAVLAHQFADYKFWKSISVLADRQIIDKTICDLGAPYFENFVLRTQVIIRRVIISHLDGSLP